MNQHFICVEINASNQQSVDASVRQTYQAEGGWPTMIKADPAGKKKSSVHAGYLPPAEFLQWLRSGV